MDTVKLEGKGFVAASAVGDQVKKGQVLLKFDMQAIAGHNIIVKITAGITRDRAKPAFRGSLWRYEGTTIFRLVRVKLPVPVFRLQDLLHKWYRLCLPPN